MVVTLTPDVQQKLREFLENYTFTRSFVNRDAPCSIAVINQVLSGKPTNEIPGCMSLVIGQWIVAIQDRMPTEIRNSIEWKRLLPVAAGTGRDPNDERARFALVMDWMWDRLSHVQPVAEQYGFGAEWSAMCREKTPAAAKAVSDACKLNPLKASAVWASLAVVGLSTEETIWCAVSSVWTSMASWDQIDPVGLLGRMVSSD